ncbi:hypothetical protein FNV43_RR25943 [Rhamnella rubrinervis]|uniref:Poor homologous synapsis 1 PH domain-containing protein n=1 Tax=Rhamnella rubrinervis TaxID=2594499 RepID=A0A8K0DLP1_9ROSA|nr:hypothetical protein FNV43_RR25943 [Rhamnella rubrinervis]
MAGSLALIPSENTSVKLAGAGKDRWEVQFSRFFNYPAIASTCAELVPLTSRVRSRRPSGTWISSSSHALLQLLRYRSNSDVILLVCLGNNYIIEEHCVSNLHFAWPQVSCISGFPARGTRAVFVSYRDGGGEIQKFALRFSTIDETEKFINALKETLNDATDTDPLTSSGFGSEISSQFEFMSSNRTQYRTCKDLGVKSPGQAYIPELPLISKMESDHEQYLHTQETMPTPNSAGFYSALPPSFTSFLTNCASDVEQAAQPTMSPDVLLKSQIAKYMEDSKFQDMLVKVEKVLHEMEGGDLML